MSIRLEPNRVHSIRIQSIHIQSMAFAGLLMGAGVGLAEAQTPPQTAGNAAPKRSAAIQEVTVTAEKRAEAAITTPIALSVFSGATLKENQIITINDLQNIDPSININRSGGLGATISLRGVTTIDASTIGEPDVVFNVDGVPFSRNFEQAEGFFDIERLEVLKGPQGTLYGASATGGVVNVVTGTPKINQYSASVDVTFGNFNTRRTTAVVNIPIDDMVAVRAAANTNAHDGYEVLPNGKPYTGGEDDWSARLSGLVNFSGDMKLQLQDWFGHVGGDGAGSANYDTLIDNPTGAKQRTVYYDPYPNSADDKFNNLTGTFNWATGPVRLTYVGGYLVYDPNEATASTNNPLANRDPFVSYAPGAIPVYQWQSDIGHYVTEYSELRISNQNPGPVDWTLGANWNHENLREDDHIWVAAWPAGSYPSYADLTSNVESLDTTFHTQEGIFGQATWHATSKLDLTGGLRGSWDYLNQQGYSATSGLTPADGCDAPNSCATIPLYHSENDRAVTYRANADYHFTPTQMVYVTVASGFKAGGFNNSCDTSGMVPCSYAPEQLTSYELGYKGRPLDNLEIDSDLFYYDYSEMQIQTKSFINGQLEIYTTDYPAVIEGLENQVVYRPTAVDELRLDITDLRSYYDKDIPIQGAGGHELSNTPAVAMTLGYSHDFLLANSATFRVHADVKYSSSYYEMELNPFTVSTQPAFTRSNADIRYTSPNGQYYIGAYIQNIENKLQIEEAPIGNGGGVPGAVPVNVTDPRTFGVTFGVKL